MQSTQILDFVPVWSVFPLTCLLVLLSWEIGFRSGGVFSKGENQDKNQSVSTMVGAVLSLLALFLAFTFNMAAGRFQERRDLLVTDANAIETTYLRAGTIA